MAVGRGGHGEGLVGRRGGLGGGGGLMGRAQPATLMAGAAEQQMAKVDLRFPKHCLLLVAAVPFLSMLNRELNQAFGLQSMLFFWYCSSRSINPARYYCTQMLRHVYY